MEWTVVTVIIALLGFVAAIVNPLTKLTRSITTLTVVVDRLKADVEEQRLHASESHRRIWEHNEGQDRRLEDHERRIGTLEHKEDSQ